MGASQPKKIVGASQRQQIMEKTTALNKFKVVQGAYYPPFPCSLSLFQIMQCTKKQSTVYEYNEVK